MPDTFNVLIVVTSFNVVLHDKFNVDINVKRLERLTLVGGFKNEL